MKLKYVFIESTPRIQPCSSDVFRVFESEGKVILSDISYQSDIWLRYQHSLQLQPPSHFKAENTLYQ